MQIKWKKHDINNGIIKSSKYLNKKHFTKTSFSIGEFNKILYQPMSNKYAYNRILLCLLGKHE